MIRMYICPYTRQDPPIIHRCPALETMAYAIQGNRYYCEIKANEQERYVLYLHM